MKTFIAFSGGVESTTLCLLFGGQADAIFADTGDEHAEMYERLGQVEGVLRTLYPSFRIIKVSAGEALHDYIRRKHVFPGPLMRFCTRIFKIEPINAYLETYAPCKIDFSDNGDKSEASLVYAAAVDLGGETPSEIVFMPKTAAEGITITPMVGGGDLRNEDYSGDRETRGC